MLSTFTGADIGNTRRKCDDHGYQLMAAALKGDGWRWRHDAVNWSVESIASAMGVRTTVEVYNLFSRHMSQEARQFFWSGQSGRDVRQGYIPDILLHLSPAVLGEFKGITPCPSWYDSYAPRASKDEFGYAVNLRQKHISRTYVRRAKDIDRKYHGTSAGAAGPFEAALRAFGGHGEDDSLTGLVIGAFGGISNQFAKLLRSLAKTGAQHLYPRMNSASMKHCESTLLWQARRTLGHTLWTARADLISLRIQHLGGAAARTRSQQRHAQFRFSLQVTRQRQPMLIGWRLMGLIWVVFTVVIGSRGRCWPRLQVPPGESGFCGPFAKHASTDSFD